MPMAPRKEQPSAYKREKLLERIRAKELFSFRVGTPAEVPDPEIVTIGFKLAPHIVGDPDGYAGYRYTVDIAVGALAVVRRGSDAIVDAVVGLADALNLRAGAMFPAISASFAHALASGAGGGFTEEQDRQVRDLAYAMHELGDKIRGPEWGTFLGAHHTEKLGGIERVETQSRCDVVGRLAGGGAYLQVTSTPPKPGDPAFAARLATVAAFLAPVMK